MTKEFDVVDGAPSRFEELMVPHMPVVHNLARHLLRNEDDAQDAVQETYLRAMRFADSFDGGNARGWLLTIVRNTCLTFLRRRATRAGMPPFDERIHGVQCGNAERALLEVEDVTLLRRRITSLPAGLRGVLIMREFQQLTYEQIALAARVPVGTVMSRLARARQQLRRCYRPAI